MRTNGPDAARCLRVRNTPLSERAGTETQKGAKTRFPGVTSLLLSASVKPARCRVSACSVGSDIGSPAAPPPSTYQLTSIGPERTKPASRVLTPDFSDGERFSSRPRLNFNNRKQAIFHHSVCVCKRARLTRGSAVSFFSSKTRLTDFTSPRGGLCYRLMPGWRSCDQLVVLRVHLRTWSCDPDSSELDWPLSGGNLEQDQPRWCERS